MGMGRGDGPRLMKGTGGVGALSTAHGKRGLAPWAGVECAGGAGEGAIARLQLLELPVAEGVLVRLYEADVMQRAAEGRAPELARSRDYFTGIEVGG